MLFDVFMIYIQRNKLSTSKNTAINAAFFLFPFSSLFFSVYATLSLEATMYQEMDLCFLVSEKLTGVQ